MAFSSCSKGAFAFAAVSAADGVSARRRNAPASRQIRTAHTNPLPHFNLRILSLMRSYLLIRSYPNIFSRNTTYPFFTSYTSALLVISQGACIFSTATPQSMTSMP